MSFARFPPSVLDMTLSKLTYDELACTKCVSKTLSGGVQLVVSSLARRMGLFDHQVGTRQLGTLWLRQMGIGARTSRGDGRLHWHQILRSVLQLWTG